MNLTKIEPKTSKISGSVFFDLYGLNFDTEKMLIDISKAAITSSSNGIIQISGQEVFFGLPAKTNERASIELANEFNEVFDLTFQIEKTNRTFPGITKTKVFGVDCLDIDNSLNKVRLFIEYIQESGYLLVVESIENGQIVERSEKLFNTSDITSLRIKGCGKYIHGYCETGNIFIDFGKSKQLTGTRYKVQAFSETPKSGVALESEIKLKKILFNKSVSFIGYPTEIIFWQDRQIRVKTVPGEISFGDIIVCSDDGLISKIENAVRYVSGNSFKTVSKKIDTVQAIYEECITPTREKLFSSVEGFTWDEGFFLSESQKNNNLYVPTLWDPSTGNVPKSFFQSGTAPEDSLKLLKIDKYKSEDVEKWYAKINHGTYFISNVPYYLFSDESIIDSLGELKTEDGRSYHNLLFPPKVGIPIIATSLGEDPETKKVIERSKLQKRGRFTGKILNGVELDSSNPKNIDPTKGEFVVIYNSNNEIKKWKIPTTNVSVGKYIFELPKKPLAEFKIRFSRKDIFKTEKIVAKRYGEDLYQNFQYGEGTEQIGDYAIDYANSRVEVILGYKFSDLGTLDYIFDYPARIEFNNDYTADNGTAIEVPTFSDLGSLDDLGMSDGTSGQKFRLYKFPIIDKSTYALPDRSNFKLFIYDEYDNSFDVNWTRVLSFDGHGKDDKVYMVNSSTGYLTFGDGVHGKIPGKYLKILAAYKPTLKIQYEPASSCDYWLGKNIDLNLTKQNISSGFLFLNRKELIPSYIDTDFASKNINSFETTDFSATVYTQEGEVVPNQKIYFETIAGGGEFREDYLMSNPNGQTSTIYSPSSKLKDLGIKIDLFFASTEENKKGTPILKAYGDENGVPYLSLKANEIIQGNIDEIYLFKILDDGDDFLPYNNITRTGGRLVVYNNGSAPIKAKLIANTIISFDNQLPQPFDVDSPNYEPNLRGFYIVGKKTVQARAYTDIDNGRIYSDIATITVEYSPLQKGVWKLPTPPVDYESSQIDTATFIYI